MPSISFAKRGATATVTNTYVPGCLEVTKVVVFGDLVGDETVDETFVVTVTGPSYPGGTSHNFVVTDGVLSGSPWTLNNLIPGDYTVEEAAGPSCACP